VVVYARYVLVVGGGQGGLELESRYSAKQIADGVTHCLLHLFTNSYGRTFLPTKSWIGSLFLRDRVVYATAAITRAAPITVPKITSIVIGYPFPSFHCVECQYPTSESGQRRSCHRLDSPRMPRSHPTAWAGEAQKHHNRQLSYQ
jgi:hypothetical protein